MKNDYRFTVILFFFLTRCTPSPQSATSTVSDSSGHTTDTQANIDTMTSRIIVNQEEVLNDSLTSGQLTEEDGELVFEITDRTGFISDPFAFSLDAEEIKQLLGSEANSTIEKFEASQDHDAYTVSTITFGNSKINFHSFSGKHSADIYTSLLPLKNNVIIGMSKEAFVKAFSLNDEEALQVNKFNIVDSYGSMEFLFSADTLSRVKIYYEEGD
jgi:hypothetical protein